MRAVFDTVVFVRGLINPRSACGRLIFDNADKFELIVSPEVVAEYLDVLWRPQIVRKYRRASGWSQAAVLTIIEHATIVEPDAVPLVSRDPGDDKFLALAVYANADAIVSEDLDLLVLNPYENVRIFSALEFLHRLGAMNGG